MHICVCISIVVPETDLNNKCRETGAVRFMNDGRCACFDVFLGFVSIEFTIWCFLLLLYHI